MKIAESFFSEQRSYRFWRWYCFSVLGVMTVTVSAKPLGKDVSIWAGRDWRGKKLYLTLLSHCLFATKMSKMRAAPALFPPMPLTPDTSTILELIFQGSCTQGSASPCLLWKIRKVNWLSGCSAAPLGRAVLALTPALMTFSVQCSAQPPAFHILLPLWESKQVNLNPVPSSPLFFKF